MAKQGLGSKLGSLPIARIKTPKGGVFNGRSIPKPRLDDPNWLRVLELDKPPQDGLYITRESVMAQKKPKPIKKKGMLYKIAKAMVDYERTGSTTGSASKSGNAASDSALKSSTMGKTAIHPEFMQKLKTQHESALAVPKIEDWNTLSPDLESSYLGLEQLERGESVSIIGAGITGLTLAWILNRARPDVHISIYDKNSEVGGWMASKHVDLPDNWGRTLFESGPRTLLPSHPGSEVLARILYEIGKRDELMAGVPRGSPTNRKGLICNGMVQQLPNSLKETTKFLTSSPILRGGRWRALKDLWNPARNVSIDDESVRSFFSRRLGPVLADRMISAVMRGIYAASIDELSARSVARMNRLYYLERTEQMSMLGAMFSGSLKYLDQYAKDALPLVFDAIAPPRASKSVSERQLINPDHPVPKFSLYGFKGGIQSMARAIADDLRTRRNVEIFLGTGVQKIEKNTARTVKLDLGTAKQGEPKQVETNIAISTIAKPEMFSNHSALSEELAGVKYSSLAVVNVWLPDPHAALDWFGILVPKTEDEWNTDGILGVIFDSSVRNAMTENPEHREKGSSMTVMMGGDLWQDGLTVEEAQQRALNGLKKMKLIDENTKLEDTIMQTTLQRNAIPLLEVGHSKRQHKVHALLQQEYNGRVAMAGMAFGRGCGVSDCIVDALTLALRFSEQRKLLHPEFFFNHWWSATRPEYYA